MSPLSIIVSLFIILNSVGNVPVFIAMLKDFSPKRRQRIIMRELFFALIIMLIFSYFGESILSLLQLNFPILRIAGGSLLFLIALDMVFPPDRHAIKIREEPYIVPLAIPIITGPGTISSIMVFAKELQNQWEMTLLIFLAWIPSITILLLGALLQRLLGEKVLLAFERFAGLILAFVAVQMVTVGIQEFVANMGQV